MAIALSRRARVKRSVNIVAAAAAAASGVIIAGSARAQSSSWATGVTGNWSDTTRWTGGIVADGIDNTATFNLDLTADATIHLDSARTIGNLVFGDTVTATPGSWILDNN